MAAGKKENQNADHMIRPVAYIHTDFPTKFGIPRQSGLTGDLEAKIVFEPEFSNPEAIRGIEEFSHLWLIWEFSENVRKPGKWSATVRPPRLGGNMRVGVFATRSPFRPNPLGLSVVKLKRVEYLENGAPVLVVTGADMMDGTPVFDIKPYVPFADSHPEAKGGFTDQTKEYGLAVEIPEEFLEFLPEEKRDPLRAVLAQDPRPSYQEDPDRVYGMEFAGYEVKFTVSPSVPVCTGRKQEAALARFRAKNSLFGFSAYSISGSAITPGTSRSGTRRIAKSLKRYVPDASGNFAFKALPRSPWYFTMISHVRSLRLKPTFSSSVRSLISSGTESARFNKFSAF